ncbi:hypothetical protein RND81_01G207700 [Saponaria officinalis]|uniref:S-adenosyl-L-methionine-dependent methyltransferase n=1 Tax=Saponaria officinalis TaxID=3572 RepID=A0AAW1N8X5_SAPOF
MNKQDFLHHQQLSSNFHHNRRPYTWRNTTNYVRNNYIFISYIILLILTYALGFFTAKSSKQNIVNPVAVKPMTVTEFTSVDKKNNCPPATSLLQTDPNNDHNIFGPVCGNPIRADSIRSEIINRVYNGTSPYENFPPAHVADLLKPKRLKGWGSTGSVFETLIKKNRPKTIIEVGTFLGASATHMAKLTRQLGLETQILCVDDFRGWPGFRDRVNYVASINGDVLLFYQFIQNVVSLNATESIIPIPFSTGSALTKLCELGVLADLIEVDAGHDFHSAWSDINMAYKLLRPGGVMFGHDYFTAYDNKGVRRAVDLFAKVHGFKISSDGQHWILDDHRRA